MRSKGSLEKEICLWLGDMSKVTAVAVGVVSLHFPGGKILVLKDYLYVPNIRRNLISVSYLSCNGFSAIFNKNFVSIKYDIDEICYGMLVDNLYILEPISHLQVNLHEYNHKRKEPSSINQAHLWHLRLGHINLIGFTNWSRVDTLVY